MPDSLPERIAEQIHAVRGNHDLYLYNLSEIARLIPLLNLGDLDEEEAPTIHYARARAYGRKLGPPPRLRLVTEPGDRLAEGTA